LVAADEDFGVRATAALALTRKANAMKNHRRSEMLRFLGFLTP
jgi:hypothetical protein